MNEHLKQSACETTELGLFHMLLLRNYNLTIVNIISRDDVIHSLRVNDYLSHCYSISWDLAVISYYRPTSWLRGVTAGIPWLPSEHGTLIKSTRLTVCVCPRRAWMVMLLKVHKKSPVGYLHHLFHSYFIGSLLSPQTLCHGGVIEIAKSRVTVHCIIQNIRRARTVINDVPL